MNSGRDELFSCSCFAAQEDAGISAGHLIDLFQHLPERRAIAYEASMTTSRLHLLLQIDIFTLKLIAKALHFLERVLLSSSARVRASALPIISTKNFNRVMRVSGHTRSWRTVPNANAPMTLPPTLSGKVALERGPNRRATSFSMYASSGRSSMEAKQTVSPRRISFAIHGRSLIANPGNGLRSGGCQL
jgi:hypothetical protein